MNEEKKVRQVIITSLAGLLVGSLLFIFGASFLSTSFVLIIVDYIIAMLLYIAAFLALYNNNQYNPQMIYRYIMILSCGLMLLITITLLSNLS